MKLSLAITVKNEGSYVDELLARLCAAIVEVGGNEYEIVIVDDHAVGVTLSLILAYQKHWPELITIHTHALNNDFAAHKNFLNSKCSGDWIFQLDADEQIPSHLLSWLPHIIDSNPAVEAYWVPRVNTVDGLTLEHVRKWGWVLDTLPEFVQVKNMNPASEEYKLLKEYNYIIKEQDGYVTYQQPIIMWPDLQMRLYKNDPNIKWERPVHERLTGFTHFSRLPSEVEYAILHHKDIARQERQNSFYETLQ